ncbi:hypothetical protein Pst134EA_003253 [Puccinia striiformis f. sp. tritici]|uniref:hypothetical protein n=1 Tax=Puccinia striiformis f. sp. tritici TaxID=168172 RepID=UPI00200813F2|nr:hypothetical protein Pst134EA_003253 [Puccinia striiformis f. sp. tritici]KAH9472647.1 hypothetical protein Pst134EA_003253 [Puccinia striiformis f. sp. tritici]KAI9611440.1 hypothetical protein H4Q26_008390 [Puccinia striiformis f. sp. tritici PST-130]
MSVLDSLQTNYLARIERRRRSRHQDTPETIAASLARRISSEPNSSWRQASFERLNQDFQSGIPRTQAVNRLRERILATTTGTTISTENNLKINTHQAYLLYCGQDNNLGCGNLISVRAALMPPKSFKALSQEQHFAEDDFANGITRIRRTRRRNPEIPTTVIMISDCLPVPLSTDTVDPITHASFQNDPTANPFHKLNLSNPNTVCTCQKTYLGCTSCGNILGHSIIKACNSCKEIAATQPHFFYAERLTVLPRYTEEDEDQKIKIKRNLNEKEEEQEEVQYHRYGLLDISFMTWAEAVRHKNMDIENGLVEIPMIDEKEHEEEEERDGEGGRISNISSTIRNAILIGSLTDVPDRVASPETRNMNTSQTNTTISPSIPHADHQERSNRRGGLTRSHALRLSDHIHLGSRLLNPRNRASSESWVIQESHPSSSGSDHHHLPPSDLRPISTMEDSQVSIDQDNEDKDDDDHQLLLREGLLSLHGLPDLRIPRISTRRQRPEDHLPTILSNGHSIINGEIFSSPRVIRRRVLDVDSVDLGGGVSTVDHLCAR